MTNGENAETTFFKALEDIIGARYLKAGKLGRRITSSDVFLDKDYSKYGLSASVTGALADMLLDLHSTEKVPSGSLAHNIDGLLVGHPELGTRIVEFDEEQHFNPFRRITLKYLLEITDAKYIPHLMKVCEDLDYFNSEVLRKHRLRVRVDSIPIDVQSFKALIEAHGNAGNGYIKPKPGFNFLGGRIAQRAYYDTLRDIAQLAKQNISLSPPIRFTKYEFEKRAGLKFEAIDKGKLRLLIEEQLEDAK